jgi:cytochrome c556
MRKLTYLTISALVLAIGSVSIGPATAAGGEAVIEKRKTFMKKEILKPFKVIKGFVKDGKGSAQDVAASARQISAVAGKIPALFPKGTSRGEYDEKMTRALPKIWEDWKGFEAATDALATESAKLAKIADGGNAAAIGAQFGKMGKLGCGGCHKPFRGAKVK